jgi:hypothetical protein
MHYIPGQSRTHGDPDSPGAFEQRQAPLDRDFHARAVTGHPLLRSAAENAARQSKMRADAANTTGQIVYNFRNN